MKVAEARAVGLGFRENLAESSLLFIANGVTLEGVGLFKAVFIWGH